MAEVNLSKSMRSALEILAKGDTTDLFVSYSTGVALERRGLVRISGQRTGGKRGLPEYMILLTAKGRKAVERLFPERCAV